MTKLAERRLGSTQEVVGGLGLGTWALGGPWSAAEGAHYAPGTPLGYGAQDEAESLRVIHAALDHGIRLIDVANLYGAGAAERLVGKALRGRAGRALVAARFGHSYDPQSRTLTGIDVSPAAIRAALETTLRNLGTETVDVFQLQVEFLPAAEAEAVFDTVDTLRREGKVRYTAWSTNHPDRLEAVAGRGGIETAQFDLNVFQDAPSMLDLCARHDLTAIARLPLAMGFLTGKFTAQTRLPADDVRTNAHYDASGDGVAKPRFWLRMFRPGGAADPAWAARLDAVREILTSDGRSLAQGALGWIWARSPRTLALPGARSVAQLEENARAREHGPLSPQAMAEIERILDRAAHPGDLVLQPFAP
ncbi:aldo/keto reductase [Salinarimonas ramus]|uniref:Aldo/keto reductase n=1 Tax=Salinarimonas ramus TaxID=690164 RepID=A0A917QGC8_9HYPH|nr:aldo/keto reductase [Salinarimonas ramus]GGK49315.1 aldo/keto reductase [Salinarimonas ramus]